MLALGGLRAKFGKGTSSGFKQITRPSCAERFQKNEAEVVYGGSEESIRRNPVTSLTEQTAMCQMQSLLS